MASFRKSGVNRPQKSSFINGNTNDTKFKGRSGVIVPNRVFVGGICPTATENDLLSLFSKYGTVKAVKIITDQNGSSKGYGFVTFEKPDDVIRLLNDAKNLMFNDRRLNIAPAVMKNPPYVGRYPDSYVVPVTPNGIYFANNIPYQYQDGASVYPNNAYAPPLTVLPTVNESAYYQNGYSSPPNFVPTTPYQGAALFYPVPHNTSPVMVGPQPYSSSYPSVSVSNSNFVYSSPAPVTSSPPSSSAKTSTAVSTITNTSEVHDTHGSQVVPTSVPPPLPYPLAHPPQYYNGTVAPPYSGEVYYNMVQGCFPVMTVSGHDAYIPYYDVPDNCTSNVAPEENNYESQNYHGTAPNIHNFVADMRNKEASSPPTNTMVNNETKQLMPVVVPQTNPTEHVQEQFVPETNPAPPPAAPAPPQTPAAAHVQHANAEYNAPNYLQHRNAAVIYPNTPIPPNNMYYNPIYTMEATTPALTQSGYPKNLSEPYVSDHLPKRDSKYSQKKFPTSPQSKDNPMSIPNIPKFPFFVNNNYPGFVNRNVKEKEYKNGNGKNNDNKQPPRPPRSNSNGSTGPKPRVFHNQNQFTANAAPPRGTHRNGNNLPMPNNMQYPRSSSAGASRQSYDQTQQIRPAYDYQNNYQGQNSHQKGVHEKKQNQSNGGYRMKYDKVNGGQSSVNNNASNETYSKNNSSTEEHPKKIQNEDLPAKTNNNNNDEFEISSEPSTNNGGNTDTGAVSATSNTQQQQQQQQVCKDMQNLAL